MKASKIVSAFLIFLSVLLAALTVLITVFGLHQKPVLLSEPQGAAAAAETVMESVRQGDFSAAAAVMQGKPDLGVDREPADIVGKLLWQEFIRTFSYEKQGTSYAADDGMAMDLTVTYLDFSSVVDTLGERTGKLLEQRVQAAENPELLYDENNQYRQELVDEVLSQAAKEGIAQDAGTITQNITVHMVYENGQWWVLPENELIHVISGGTAG